MLGTTLSFRLVLIDSYGARARSQAQDQINTEIQLGLAVAKVPGKSSGLTSRKIYGLISFHLSAPPGSPDTTGAPPSPPAPLPPGSPRLQHFTHPILAPPASRPPALRDTTELESYSHRLPSTNGLQAPPASTVHVFP
ncbi:hypothetical protein Tco_0290490 [Tanacetum coccineum]